VNFLKRWTHGAVYRAPIAAPFLHNRQLDLPPQGSVHIRRACKKKAGGGINCFATVARYTIKLTV
jgi:hypothetical protein